MKQQRNRNEMTLADAFGSLRSDYDLNKQTRYIAQMRGVSSLGSGADYHYRSETDYLRGIERARMLDRNNMVLGQGVSRLIDNVLQGGFTLDPQTGSDELDEKLQARWREWSADPEACDDSGEHSFDQMVRLLMRSVIVDGDVVVLPLKERGTIEIVEAHRIRTSKATKQKVINGVLLNERRQHVEYWITKKDISPYAASPRMTDITRIPTRDSAGRRQLFHLYRPHRFSQTRGVSAFAPIVSPASMLDDLQFTHLVQAQVAACYTIMRERVLGFEGDGASTQTGSQETETQSDGSTRTIEGIAPGMEIIGEPGEKLIGFSPNIPNPEFFQHAMMTLSIIAANLGMPLQLLLLDATKTNFSGWRGAMDQARIGFRDWQKWLVATLHTPVYLWKVEQWLAEDPGLRAMAALADVDALARRWNVPSWPYLEPLKDANAARVERKGNQISPAKQAAQRGHDWNELAPEIVQNNAKLFRFAIEEAAVLNTESPEAKVDWRELANVDAREESQQPEQDEPDKPVGAKDDD